jgi:hypothetical protein
MKYLFLICLVLFGCDNNEKEPISISTTDNQNIAVDKLFTHDGCIIYRFRDRGYNHYFTKCEKADSRTESMQGCGKNCIRAEEIEVKQ